MRSYQRRTISGYLKLLSAGTPTPGGGSVSALGGALGAALGAMVCDLARRRLTDKKTIRELTLHQNGFLANQARLLDLCESDSMAYEAVLSAYRLSRKTPQQKRMRQQRIQTAMEEAARVPLQSASLCLDNIRRLKSIQKMVPPQMKSDFSVGLFFSQAGLKGCLANVRINLSYLKDSAFKRKLQHWLFRVSRLSRFS